MAKLIYSDGTDQEFALDSGRAAYTIGRNPMCDLRINNPSISRKHAEFRLDAASGAYSVYDLNSSNGTYVNGTRHQQQELSNGDEIMCGEFKIFFYTGDGPARPPSPSGGPPPPPPPPPRRHSKTLAAKPGDLFSAEAKGLQALTSPNSEATMKVSSELLKEAMPAEPPAPVAKSGDSDRELKAAKAELKSLRLALQNETGRASNATQESAKLQKEIDRLKKEIDSGAKGGGDRVAELEAELKDRDATIAKLEKAEATEDVEKLKAELAEAKKQAIAAKAGAAKAAGRGNKGSSAGGAEVTKLKADLAKRDEEIESLKKEAAKVKALEGELEVARSQLEELQGPADGPSVDELQQKNSAMKEAFKDLSAELKELVAANRELAKKLASLKG